MCWVECNNLFNQCLPTKYLHFFHEILWFWGVVQFVISLVKIYSPNMVKTGVIHFNCWQKSSWNFVNIFRCKICEFVRENIFTKYVWITYLSISNNFLPRYQQTFLCDKTWKQLITALLLKMSAPCCNALDCPCPHVQHCPPHQGFVKNSYWISHQFFLYLPQLIFTKLTFFWDTL